MPKEGDVREDGLVFWRNRKDRGEVWLTAEKYAAYCQKRKEYTKMCLESYRQRQSQLPDDEKNYFGRYDWKTNKYFVGVTTSGKEIWMYKARFEKRVERNKIAKLKFLRKMQSLENTGLRLGDRNPDNPEQFVIGFIGRRPRFGNQEKLMIAKMALKVVDKKSRTKRRKKRTEILKKLVNKMRRGYVDPVSGLVFWEYNSSGKPTWYNAEHFKAKRDKELARKKARRNKNNQSKDINVN